MTPGTRIGDIAPGELGALPPGTKVGPPPGTTGPVFVLVRPEYLREGEGGPGNNYWTLENGMGHWGSTRLQAEHPGLVIVSIGASVPGDRREPGVSRVDLSPRAAETAHRAASLLGVDLAAYVQLAVMRTALEDLQRTPRHAYVKSPMVTREGGL